MSKHDHDDQLVAKLERLKAQGENMRDLSIRAKANLEQANKEGVRLREEAVKKFGSSDPKVLMELLEKWRRENDEMVRDYETLLSTTSARLEELGKILE